MMTQNEILKASYEDLIFENRNKAYGAYDLRVKYEKNLRNALIIAVSLILMLVLTPVIMRLLSPAEKYDTALANDTPVEMTAPPPLDETLPPPPKIKLPEIAQIKFVPPKIVEKVQKEEEIHTIEEIKAVVNTGSKDVEGTNVIITEPVKAIIKEVEKPEEPVLFVEKMPTFPGGDQALYDFINKNIRYPQQAQDYNIQGQVIVQFVVNKDGHITDPKVLKDIKGGCGEEALRIVRMMPSWNAGEQSGRKVPVFVRVPIKFQLK